jgi:hypothetical protein
MCRYEYVFQSPKILDFAIFCLAHNNNNFGLRFCMLKGYTSVKIQNYFQVSLSLQNMFFIF